MTTTSGATLVLADGRTLAYQCFGDPRGRPLHVFHGFPGSRLQAAILHVQAAAAGICLVAADRPGFGESSPLPSRTLLGWSDDIAQLADSLGHNRFGVLGISCGGPYALACARRMPARVSYAGLLAGIGPMDRPELCRDQHSALRLLFALARIHPRLASPFVLLDRMMFLRDSERAVRALGKMLAPPDRRLIESDADLVRLFGASLAVAYRQGLGGALVEAALIAGPRDFRLEDISVPVHLYQGGRDRHVPVAMANYMAERIPRATLRLYPEEGHLSIVVKAFDDVRSDFLATP